MDAETYKAWFKENYNFMTPELIDYEILDNGYIVEFSEGTTFDHKPFYGVTLLGYKGDKIINLHGEDRNRCGTVEAAMQAYFDELIEIVEKWGEI